MERIIICEEKKPMVNVETAKPTRAFIESDVQKIMKENEMYYEWYVDFNGKIVVIVEWGDWKHDHIFLENVMAKNGYLQTDEELTEEDGSDTYSAIHTFEYVSI